MDLKSGGFLLSTHVYFKRGKSLGIEKKAGVCSFYTSVMTKTQDLVFNI